MAADFTATVTWGDGNVESSASTGSNVSVVQTGPGAFSVVGSHTYAEELSDAAFSVSVADDGGAETGTSNTSFSVADAPLHEVAVTVPTNVVAGTATPTDAVLYHFADDNPNGAVGDYTAKVKWGDGTSNSSNDGSNTVKVVSDSSGGFDVVGWHTYKTAGTGLTFDAEVHDEGGAYLGATGTFSVAAPTAVALSSSASPSTYGDPKLAFTATVSAASGAPASGTVTFYDDTGTTFGAGTMLGTVGVDAKGKAVLTLNPNTLPAGARTIEAHYSGDGATFAPGNTAKALTQTVNKAGTTTALASDHGRAASGTNPAYGTSVTFTATVSVTSPGAGAPTGTVSFYVDGSKTAAATVTLSGGQAQWSTTALGVSATGHTVKAVYSGDSNFLTSAGTASQKVKQAATTTSLASDHGGVTSGNPVYGQVVTFTATVTSSRAAVPDGDTVSFYIDGATTAAATVKLKGGQATFSRSTLSAGKHIVKAVFNGDANFTASNGSSFQVVDRANTTTTLLSSKPTSGVGEKVTFTATVAPVSPGGGVPGGSVSFFLDGATKAAKVVTLSGGTASWSTSWSAPGTHTVHAVYSPSTNPTNYITSQTGTSPSSGDLTQNVLPATKVALSSSGTPWGGASYSLLNDLVTFTATVTAAQGGAYVPSGPVTFYDGSTVLGTVHLNGKNRGVITWAASSLALGGHTITAVYGGNTDYAGSSASLTQVVQAVDHLKATLSPTVGGTFSIMVTACDSAGNPVVALSGVVTLELVSAPSGGTVTGPGSANLVDGQALFPNLKATGRGGFRLRAHLGGLFVDVTFSTGGPHFGIAG
jgi:hypothetical protein